MKLIFLHQAKAGGATVRNILDPSLRWLNLEEVPLDLPAEKLYELFNESDVIQNMSFSFNFDFYISNYSYWKFF